MNSSLVSIIIPCFNQGHYIKEAVNSALEQSYNDIEIIIVNDGSTDGTTANIIDEIASLNGSIVKVIHTTNQGLSLARNTGIELSKGSFIVPLDSDNKLDKFFVEKAMINFNKNISIDIIYSDAFYFGANHGIWHQLDMVFPLMLKRNLIDACSIFRRSVWNVCNGYKSNMKYGWEDWDFWLTAYENSCIFFHLQEPLFYYRVSFNSMRDQIAAENEKRQYLEYQIILNHSFLYKKYFPEPLTLLRHHDFLNNEKENYERYKLDLQESLSYRLGNFLLGPFKYLFRILPFLEKKHN
jgi:glycosyltransferase involved in cell wall biosynthesis